jgi:hypothetical protein
VEIAINAAELVTPTAVLVTSWRTFEKRELKFLRSIDMSALKLAEFPRDATLSKCSWLESAILPPRLRVLPTRFFERCWRLSHIDTSGCTVLDTIGMSACEACRDLSTFDFPRTIRRVDACAFLGTAVQEVDLSETVARFAVFSWMVFLERLTLPRRCAPCGLVGVAALRSLTLGRAPDADAVCFGSHLREIRFGSFLAPRQKAAGLASARVHAEVAAVWTGESRPSVPP